MILEFLSYIDSIVPNKMHQVGLLVGVLTTILLTILSLTTIVQKRNRRKTLRESTEYVLLQIIHTPQTAEKAPGLDEIHLFEDLLHSIVLEKKPITFEIAVPNTGTDILFFVAVPPDHVETVQNQVRRTFEQAQIRKVPDYTIFHKTGNTILADVSLKKFYGLPIRTYRKNDRSTFASIVGAFAAVNEKDTGMAMQLVLQKAPKRATGEITSVVKQLQSGKKLKYIKPTNATDSILGFVHSWTHKSSDEKGGDDNQETQFIEEKSRELLYRANIRIGVCAPTKGKADQMFDTLQDRFDQFSPSGYNGFVFSKREDRKIVLDFSFRLVNLEKSITLTAEEISSVFHLLSQNIEVANLKWEKTKRIAAPTEIGDTGTLLGDNVFHGKKTPVYIPEQDRLRHLYVIGQTGTGKTALIKSLAYQDIQNGKGVCIIDPHGDLIDDMVAVVPESRLDDVIIFDPSDIEHSLAVNMLEYDRSRPEEKTFIIDEILSIFHKLFSATPEGLGPVFEQYMRNSLLLLMEGSVETPATLLDVPRVLTDDDFRAGLLKNCNIEPVRRFWEEEAQKVEGEASLSNIAPYITSKFTGFISNDYVRPIISQPYSSFSFRKVMDEKKILFVKLSQGKIGEINTGLLGMITTGKIALAAFSRDDIPQHERQDFFLYIDEFQNFTTNSISKILSEARKYRLSLTVAHQFMAQLTDDIRGAVLGNVGTTISFRVGIEDAEILAKKFTPGFTAQELTNTENLNCVISMLSNNMLLQPFTMQIRFAPSGSVEVREKIAQYAALKYGKKQTDTQTKEPTPPAT